jgi:rod shape-determining protein MreD
MRKSGFFAVYAILVVAQMLLSNYFHLTQYILLSILPVMVLCIPLNVSTSASMVIAFVTGLLVDLLSEGLLGLNALALVPVAFARKEMVRLIFGEELLARGEDFSVRRSGLGQVVLAMVLAQALFLFIYIWADSAGTRPFWFNFLRFICSLPAGVLVSLLVVDTLAPDSRK